MFINKLPFLDFGSCGSSIVVSIRRCQRCDPSSSLGSRIFPLLSLVVERSAVDTP